MGMAESDLFHTEPSSGHSRPPISPHKPHTHTPGPLGPPPTRSRPLTACPPLNLSHWKKTRAQRRARIKRSWLAINGASLCFASGLRARRMRCTESGVVNHAECGPWPFLCRPAHVLSPGSSHLWLLIRQTWPRSTPTHLHPGWTGDNGNNLLLSTETGAEHWRLQQHIVFLRIYTQQLIDACLRLLPRHKVFIIHNRWDCGWLFF